MIQSPLPGEPKRPPTKLDLAQASHREGRLDDAAAQYEAVLAAQQDFEALYGLGLVRLRQGRIEEAREGLQAAANLNPGHIEAVANLGLALKSLGRNEEALARFEAASALRPDLAHLHVCRGDALMALVRPSEALASYEKALSIQPALIAALNNRGNALQGLRRFDEALASYDRTLALKPDFVDALVNRGIALKALGRPTEAVAAYDRALALRPGHVVALNNRGNVLCDLRRPEEALANYDAALAGAPDFEPAHYGRGNAVLALRLFDEALASFDRALALRPDRAEARNNRGRALRELGRTDEALADYDAALALKEDLVEAHFNRGGALIDLKREGEAVASYARALALQPDFPALAGVWLNAKMRVCDWAGFEQGLAALVRDIEAGKLACAPFSFLGLVDSPALQSKVARRFAASAALAGAPPAPAPAPPRRERIRIGYFSSDFYDHAGAHLIVGLLERHDRAKFEIFAFSYGAERDDFMRRRIVAAVDHFIDISRVPDKEAAALARGQDIDIAVDRNVYTGTGRFRIFAHRAAPIQVNFLGYPGTSGADYMDYLIADPTVIPESAQSFYSENIVYLPHSYQANDDKRAVSSRAFARAEQGLPETAFVFCCFNDNYKILPDVFDVWMRALKQVDAAVLWLLGGNDTAVDNLRAQAARRGVDPRRLVFAKRIDVREHLARHRLADLFLDTWPYNAHTTASDALWTGVPVLTRAGESFPARVAASLLNAVGVPELVTADAAAYERLAVDLAHDPERLAALNRKLADNRLTAPLFDTARYARHIEAAYSAMYERHLSGLAPEPIHVPRT